jgi:hypothetical protein
MSDSNAARLPPDLVPQKSIESETSIKISKMTLELENIDKEHLEQLFLFFLTKK